MASGMTNPITIPTHTLFIEERRRSREMRAALELLLERGGAEQAVMDAARNALAWTVYETDIVITGCTLATFGNIDMWGGDISPPPPSDFVYPDKNMPGAFFDRRGGKS